MASNPKQRWRRLRISASRRVGRKTRRRMRNIWGSIRHEQNRIARWWASHRGEKDYLEAVFLTLFIAAFAFAVLNILWLSFFHRTLVYNDIIPKIDESYDWEDFRSLMFGLAGFVGAVFGFYQLTNSATRTRLTRIDTNTKREAERNERFVSAAKLLADADPSVRMAGVFALERLATEDDSKYLSTVAEVLSGFVRDRTNHKDYEPKTIAGPSPEKSESTQNLQNAFTSIDQKWSEWYANWAPPTEPVQAAVKALQRLTRERIDKNQPVPEIDLRGAKLPRLLGSNYCMRKWLLIHCHLEGSDFSFADFSKTKLDSAQLQKCDLLRTDFTNTQAINSNLSSSFAYEANFDEGNFREATFDETDVTNASFKNTELTSAKLFSADTLKPSQLDEAAWPIGDPPELPPKYNVADFDKSWCTHEDIPELLLPRSYWDNRTS